MTDRGRRQTARRFLEGLSTDELQYIAAYFGARLLDSKFRISEVSRAHLAHRIEQYERDRKQNGPLPPFATEGPGGSAVASQVAHKMILLLEYLSISLLHREQPTAWTVEAGSA